MSEKSSKVPNQVIGVLIETGIQMLKIVKDLNDNDQLFHKSEKIEEKGAINDNPKVTSTGAKEVTADSY